MKRGERTVSAAPTATTWFGVPPPAGVLQTPGSFPVSAGRIALPSGLHEGSDWVSSSKLIAWEPAPFGPDTLSSLLPLAPQPMNATTFDPSGFGLGSSGESQPGAKSVAEPPPSGRLRIFSSVVSMHQLNPHGAPPTWPALAKKYEK